jgi:putative membrane protein
MTIADFVIGILSVLHFAFAFREFSGRNRASFYQGFNIELAEKQDPAQIGRIVTNAALFNVLLALGLVVSLVPMGEQNLLLKEYLLVAIIIAGIVGGMTLKPIVAVLQSVPAAVALVLLLLGK